MDDRRRELQEYFNIDTEDISEEGIIEMHDMQLMINDPDVPRKFKSTLRYLFKLAKKNNQHWQDIIEALRNGNQYDGEMKGGAIEDPQSIVEWADAFLDDDNNEKYR